MGTHRGSTGLGGGGRLRPGHTLASAGAGPRPRPHPADVPTHGRTPAPGGHVLSVTPRNSRRAAGLNGSDDHVPGPSQGDVCLVLRQKHPGAVAGSQRPSPMTAVRQERTFGQRREEAASTGGDRGLGQIVPWSRRRARLWPRGLWPQHFERPASVQSAAACGVCCSPSRCGMDG